MTPYTMRSFAVLMGAQVRDQTVTKTIEAGDLPCVWLSVDTGAAEVHGDINLAQSVTWTRS